MEKAPIVKNLDEIHAGRILIPDTNQLDIRATWQDWQKRIAEKQRDADHEHYEAEYAKRQPFSEEAVRQVFRDMNIYSFAYFDKKYGTENVYNKWDKLTKAIMSLKPDDNPYEDVDEYDHVMDDCPECLGLGEIPVPDGAYTGLPEPCERCHGTGKKQPDEKVRDNRKLADFIAHWMAGYHDEGTADDYICEATALADEIVQNSGGRG